MSDNTLEYTVHIGWFAEGEPVSISIPLDVSRVPDIHQFGVRLVKHSPKYFQCWITAMLPQTPENIEIEKQHEQKLMQDAARRDNIQDT